jgi:hypothetical protein
MKRRFGNSLVITAGLLALVCMVSAYAGPQQKTGEVSAPGYGGKARSKPLPEGGPAPRLADGHPDLSGVWFIGLLGKEDATLVGSFGVQDPAQRAFDPKVTPEEKPSFQPWAAEKVKQQRAHLLSDTRDSLSFDKLPKDQQIAALDMEILKLSRNCMPHGAPGMFLAGARPIQLVESPGLFVQLAELNHDYRVIPTDGRAHTKDPDPAFNGESVGHWEGDTLVVDTIAIDERVWNTDEWTFHSDQEHVIERVTRPSLNYLVYQVTIEDPKVLTKPWTSAHRHWSLGHEPLQEWYCGVNAHDDEEIQALKLRRQQLAQQN